MKSPGHDLPTLISPPGSPDLDPLLHLPDIGPITTTYQVCPSEPVVWQGCPSKEVRDQLIAHWHAEHDAGRLLPPAFNDPVPAELTLPPESFHREMTTLLSGIADHFRLPFTPLSMECAIGRYGSGGRTEWHVDAPPEHPEARKRTVAFVLFLNDDFTGGSLQFADRLIDPNPGDVVGFTSRTWHRVTPVTSGERFVVLGFGGWPAPDESRN